MPSESFPSSRVPRSGGSAGEFVRGAGDFWRGLAFLIGHPRLWPLSAIPFVLNVCLFVFLYWLGWHFLSGWLGERFFGEGIWWRIIGWLISALYWIVAFLVIIFAFVPLASLLAEPFNDLLSEKVERLYAGQGVDESFSVRGLVRGLTIGLGSTLRLTVLTLLLLALAMTLHVVPVIGSLLATAVAMAITIRFLSLQYTSYSMDRRAYSFARRREFLRRNRARTIGMGAMAAVLMVIPIVNALFIPVSAVAGTLLFCDAELNPDSPKRAD